MLFTYAIASFILCSAYGQQRLPDSPCPDIFRYEYDGSDYTGVVEATQAQRYPTRITLEVVMVVKALINRGSYVGRIFLDEPESMTNDRIRSHLPMKFKVAFPLRDSVPAIERISFNGRAICETRANNRVGTYTTITLNYALTSSYGSDSDTMDPPPDPFSYESRFPPSIERITRPPPVERITRPPVTDRITRPPVINMPRTTPPPTQSQRPSSNADFKCGQRRIVLNNKIHGGEVIDRGDWPWLGALFWKTSNEIASATTCFDFQCAASLISEKIAITAAHCMFMPDNQRIEFEDLLLKFGAHNLLDWGENNVVSSGVESYRIRDDYGKVQQFSHDIAVLKMKNIIKFSAYVVPACIWPGSDDQDEVIGKNGNVAGWGRSENGTLLLDAPRMVEIEIVSSQTCRSFRQEFYALTSNYTFCAGNRDGRGPCKGDSGGGLFVELNGSWYLRGIVSSALNHPTLTCDLSEHTVFTDFAKYISWVNET